MKWKTLFISAILFLLPVNLWAAVPASSPDASASQEAWSFLQEAGSRFWEASEEFLEYSGELLEEAGDLFQGFLSEGEEAKEDPARFSFCYYYGQLTEEEKAVYASLYDGLMAGEEKIYLKTGEKEILEKVTQLLLQDHPEIFWFEGTSQYTMAVGRTLFRPVYLMSQEERSRQEAELLAAAEEFLSGIDTEASEYEKIRSVFRHVINTVEYDLSAPDNQMVTSAMVGRRSVCSGYAKEVQYLLQQLGIPCLYVAGRIGEGSHAWNIVRCDGQWYQLDATFGDPSFGKNSRAESVPEELKISYSYLCCTDEEMYRDHTPDVPVSLPVCDRTDRNYYRLQGTYYDTYPDGLKESLRQSIQAGESSWQCQFAHEEDYRSFLGDMEDGLYLNLVGEIMGPGSYRVYWIYNETMRTVGCWRG